MTWVLLSLIDTIRAVDLAKLGVTVYDPGFLNTASCISRITYIDGDKGYEDCVFCDMYGNVTTLYSILRYRGYPIEELAEKSSFMEVSCRLSLSRIY